MGDAPAATPGRLAPLGHTAVSRPHGGSAAAKTAQRSDDVQEALQESLSSLSPVSEPSGPEEFLRVLSTAQEIETEARRLLQQTVLSARRAGTTWSAIGETLGISKQAAQKRFTAQSGAPDDPLSPHERLLGPVDMFNEMDELNLAGRYGWHSIGFDLSHHRVAHSATQWEHIRVMDAQRVPDLEESGWSIIGKAFPYTFLTRDTGVPALKEP